jgi:hypothetical protein
MEAAMKRPVRNGWIHLSTIAVNILLWLLIISSPRLYVVIRDTALFELAHARLTRGAEKLAGKFRWAPPQHATPDQ